MSPMNLRPQPFSCVCVCVCVCVIFVSSCCFWGGRFSARGGRSIGLVIQLCGTTVRHVSVQLLVPIFFTGFHGHIVHNVGHGS